MSDFDWIHRKIKNQSGELPSEWMLSSFKAEAKRQGAQSKGTQANYLKALRKILVQEDIDVQKIDGMSDTELETLNKRIADNIQNSKYRKSEGEDGVRRKRQYWKSWKTVLETQGRGTEPRKPYMPKVEWIEPESKKGKITEPGQIPTRDQTKQFVKNLGDKSREHVALRNQALALLLWDKGPRIGEALSIKLKHVEVDGKKLLIKIPGNKGSDTRTVPVYQGRKTIKDWVQRHPYRGNPEAYLFPVLQKDKPETSMASNTGLDSKFHACAKDLDFKTSGEPFHIFRKGMVSSHFINDWASWEDICEWHGKSNDSTKPDYLLMLMEDVNVSVGESMGIDEEAIPERTKNTMQGSPLKPLKCRSCDKLNRCYLEICEGCGTELPEADIGGSLSSDEEQKRELEQLRSKFEELQDLADKLGVDY